MKSKKPYYDQFKILTGLVKLDDTQHLTEAEKEYVMDATTQFLRKHKLLKGKRLQVIKEIYDRLKADGLFDESPEKFV